MTQLDNGGTGASPATAIVETRYGRLNYLVNDDPIGYSLREYGEWGQTELEKVLALVHDGDHVLDVGAHVGSYTLAFSNKVGASGKVTAFEAQPFLSELLKSTIQLNHLENVEVIGNAVSDRAEIMAFDPVDYGEHANTGAVRLSSEITGSREKIVSVTIDEFSFDRCDLIKCDVEGMTCKVLAGAAETIRTHRPIIVSEVNDLREGVDIFRSVKGLSYDVWLIVSPAFNARNFKNNPKNMFGYAAEVALIAVHSEAPRPVALNELGHKIDTYDQLASLILQCPRYGDVTDYDRNPDVLRSKVAELCEENKQLSYRNELLERRFGENLSRLRHLEEKSRELELVYSSYSWRVTAPLRKGVAILRRVIRRA